MARSVWKGPFVDASVLKHARKARATGSKSSIRIYSRRSVIIPEFVGLNFSVYNGRKFIPVFITEDTVGHKLGEFSPTRVFYSHAGGKKAKIKR